MILSYFFTYVICKRKLCKKQVIRERRGSSMAEDKEKNIEVEEEEELDLDELSQVSGGALRNVKKERTTAIGGDTIGKI